MSVVQMVIDVQDWSPQRPGDSTDGDPAIEIVPLFRGSGEDGGGPASELPDGAAAVASACGVRPAGFAAELVSRPGRDVFAWLAIDAAAPTPRGDASAAGVAGAVARPGHRPQPAGVVLLQVSAPRGGGDPRVSIPWLLVAPRSRRRGVGRALVGAAVDGARALGARRVAIDTLDRWPETLAFWRELGFRPN